MAEKEAGLKKEDLNLEEVPTNLRDRLLAKKAGKSVAFKFMDEEVFLKKLKGRVLEKITKVSEKKIENTDLMFHFIILCVVDKEDNPVFTSEDFETIKDFPMKEVQELGTECMKLNGFMQTEEEADSLKKN